MNKNQSELEKALLSQGNTPQEVKNIISEMVACFEDGEDVEEILSDYGLEPDYVFDLVGLVSTKIVY